MRWVFNIKNDDRYRARLVAQGFSQIPGIDYFDSHSQVMNEISFIIILIVSLHYKYDTISIDIKRPRKNHYKQDGPKNQDVQTR